MQQVIHYHDGGVCPPHDGSCNNQPAGITTSNEFDCSLVAPGTYQCSHLTS